MFDNFLWTISDDYRVIVKAGRFTEAGPELLQLSRYHGQPLYLPPSQGSLPGRQYLAWHREQAEAVGNGGSTTPVAADEGPE